MTDSLIKFFTNLSARGWGVVGLALSLLSFAVNWYKIKYEGVYYPLFVIVYVPALLIALALIILPTRWIAPIKTDGQHPYRQLTRFGKVVGAVLFILGAVAGLVVDYYLRNGF